MVSRVLAIDPSISEAAAALVTWDGTSQALEAVWRIRPKGDDLGARLESLGLDVQRLIAGADAELVIVELPAERRAGPRGFANRSVVTLPTYGASVGVCCEAARRACADDLVDRVRYIPVTSWTRAIVSPSSFGDDYKRSRVAFAARLFGREVADFGPVSVAGNAADAALIAAFGVLVLRGLCA